MPAPGSAAAGAPGATIIGFTPNDYADWTSRRRILAGLADRQWPTVYSSGARTIWDRREESGPRRGWRHRMERHGNLRVDVASRLLVRWPTVALCDQVALAAHAKHLASAFDARSCAIALLFHPAYWPYVSHLKPRHVVYYAFDAFRLTPGWDTTLERLQRDLVDRADLVIAYSQGMLDCMPSTAQRAIVLPPGVDVAPFEAAAFASIPADLARIPKPRIGYLGRINQKLDFHMVYDIAKRRPRWHWVFVGSIGANAKGAFAADRDAEAAWSRCCALPNVHVLGAKPHAQIAPYLLHMDVNAMCYRTDGNGWWSEIFPLKSMEYLAAGRPIVSAPVKSIRAFAGSMAFASTAEDWVRAIEQALDHGGVGTVQSRRDAACANTWDDRIDALQEALLRMIDPQAQPRSTQAPRGGSFKPLADHVA